jgi:hypothetical protein
MAPRAAKRVAAKVTTPHQTEQGARFYFQIRRCFIGRKPLALIALIFVNVFSFGGVLHRILLQKQFFSSRNPRRF